MRILIICLCLSLIGMVIRRNKTVFITLLVTLFVLASNNLTSPDRGAYQVYFASINSPTYSTVIETGFQILIWFSKLIGVSYEGFYYLYYAICFIFLYLIIRKLSNNMSMVLSLYMFYPYILDIDQMRFMLGHFIVTFALAKFMLGKNISKKSMVYYIIFCIVASMFQQSCIIYLLFLFCRSNRSSIRRYSLIVSIFILERKLILLIAPYIGILNTNRVENYFAQIAGKSNWYIYMLFYIALIMFTLFFISKCKNVEYLRLDDSTIVNLNILSIGVVALIFINPHFERLVRPIILLDYISLTNMIKPKITRYYEIAIIFFLCLFSIGRFLTYFYGAGFESYIKPIFGE